MGPAVAMTTRCQWTVSPNRVSLAAAPAARPTGWDAGRVRYSCSAVSRQRRGGGSGDLKRAQPKLSQVNGLGAEAPSQNPPAPHRGAPKKEEPPDAPPRP